MLPVDSVLSVGEKYFLLAFAFHLLMVLRLVVVVLVKPLDEDQEEGDPDFEQLLLARDVETWSSVALLALWIVPHLIVIFFPKQTVGVHSIFQVERTRGKIADEAIWLKARGSVRHMQHDEFVGAEKTKDEEKAFAKLNAKYEEEQEEKKKQHASDVAGGVAPLVA